MKLPHRRQFLHLAASAAAISAVSRIAWAQFYPMRIHLGHWLRSAPVRISAGRFERRMPA